MSSALDFREPLSDIELTDESFLVEYRSRITRGQYSSAITYLDDFDKGIRASTFNKIKEKILELGAYLLNLSSEKDTIVSINQPSIEQMQGKIYWIQPWLGGNEMGILRSVRRILHNGEFLKSSEWQLAKDVECQDGSTLENKLDDIEGKLGGYRFIQITQSAYDALQLKDSKTIYMIL